MRTMATVLALGVIQAGALNGELATIRVEVDQPGHAVSPLLWGIFFEDINLSADGGIYPEQVRNRSFEDADKPEHWAAVGAADIAIDSALPLNPLNPRSLRVMSTGPGGGVVNAGYWGMALKKGDHYGLSFYARGAGALSARLENADGSVVYAKTKAGRLAEAWQSYRLTLKPKGTDPRARLVITTDRRGTFWLDMVSLLPAKTWKGHGLRPDLCEMLAALKPAFLRFPGGCWVEGDTMSTAYRWKTTIGDMAQRKPLWNLWGYWATQGLGYHEYLQLCEDLGAEPLFCINVGMSHKEVVPLDQMDEYVQDALDAIEYANGPADRGWGARRAEAGHPKPFGLKYLEIGNENGGPAYHERWVLFYDAIKARYPEVQLIANVWGGYPTQRLPEIVDEHYYNTPEFFAAQAGLYDAYDRSGPKVFVGEYAVTNGCGQGNLRGALGEAAFMTGLERNSDVVVMAAYAPLFVNVNHKHWNPDLINFDSTRAYGLPSYTVQRLFAENRGEVVLPVTVQAPADPSPVRGGGIGVGTWATQAEFKDIRVTQGDRVLFASDFSRGTEGWRLRGGKWQVKDGALQQLDEGQNIRATIGDASWTDYTLSLKARKLAGAEGFLISFRMQDEGGKGWWNLGGWGNVRHGLEMEGVSVADVPGQIETGRWYDVRIEWAGTRVRCFLDNALVQDAEIRLPPPLHVSATRAGEEVLLKVVNVATGALEAQLDLRGAARVSPKAMTVVLKADDPAAENTIEQPNKVAAVEQELSSAAASFRHTFPAHSLTVIRLRAPPAPK
jgi:alpha-L-arabinofuranosidase